MMVERYRYPTSSQSRIACFVFTATILNACNLVDAFTGLSTLRAHSWNHLVETSTSKTLGSPSFAWKHSTKLEASVVADVQKSFPRNETDFSGRKGKKGIHEVTERRQFADDYLFNEALNELASKAGDVRQPVVRRAVACEDMWKDFCSSPQSKWEPDTVSFNTVLKAWAKAGGILVDQHSDSSTPQYLLDPDVPIFTARDCAQRALDLLNEQEAKYEEMAKEEESLSASIARPDALSYNTAMDAWAKARTPEALPEVQALMKRMIKRGLDPDRVSFTLLMEAHAFSEGEDRLDEVQKIWNHMEASKNPKVHPNAHSLVSLMHCFSRVAAELVQNRDDARVRQLSDQAMSFFQRQEERYEESKNRHDLPGAYVYTAAMDVLGKVGTRDAAHRAERMWQKLTLLEKQADGDDAKEFRKSIYTYAAVISAWSRVTPVEPEATQRIVDLVEELWNDDSVHLNSRPFAAALRGIARSNYPLEDQPNKAIVALNLIKRMREAGKEVPGVRPSLLVYHAALDCCSRILASNQCQSALSKDGSTIESESTALKIAFALFQAMIADNITPNSETYTKLLSCATYLLPVGEERTKVAESVFLKAKRAGVADKNVLRCFQKAVDSTFWNDFIEAEQLVDEKGRIDWRKVPRTWNKNSR